MKCLPTVLFLVLGNFLAGVRAQSLAYVLQADQESPDRAAAVVALEKSGRDVLVIDEFFRGSEPYTKSDISAIRSGRPGRKVLAYLSVGEAEDYRPYWRKTWRHEPPTFLLGENPEWKGNYRVKYWDPEWQSKILASLDRILRAGFDGVYLDIVDAFEGFEYDPKSHQWRDGVVNPETGRTYRKDMVAWVNRIAGHARSENPAFWIVPQNASQLLGMRGYANLIDAIGIEDLFTIGNKIQDAEGSSDRLAFLKPFVAAGKPVFDIEYATRDTPRKHAVREARAHGLSLLVTDRSLCHLGCAFPRGGPAPARDP